MKTIHTTTTTTIHQDNSQQYTQENYSNTHKTTHNNTHKTTHNNTHKTTTTIHTRQLQQYTQDNYNNTQKTTNNNTHKTSSNTTCTKGKQKQGNRIFSKFNQIVYFRSHQISILPPLLPPFTALVHCHLLNNLLLSLSHLLVCRDKPWISNTVHTVEII